MKNIFYNKLRYQPPDNEEREKRRNSAIRIRLILYFSVIYIVLSIYLTDSFSTWKLMAIILPLYLSFINKTKTAIITGLIFITFFTFMLVSVGTIFNHDLLELTGPLVCPEGYAAQAETLVSHPEPGTTNASSRLRCVRGNEVYYPNSILPHLFLFLLYLFVALPLFLISVTILNILNRHIPKSMFKYIIPSLVYFSLGYLVWNYKEEIINFFKFS